MDPRHEDIAVGLYVRDADGGPIGTVHSYSSRPGTPERLATIARTMCEFGGMREAGAADVRFDCGHWHQAAARRLFIEACRHDPAVAPSVGELEVDDSRSGQRITVVAGDAGSYRVFATGATTETPSRAPAIARAMAKLAQLDTREDDDTLVSFPCRSRHDQLVALLLGRAQNLRQILREEELSANRGVLAAPSAQD